MFKQQKFITSDSTIINVNEINTMNLSSGKITIVFKNHNKLEIINKTGIKELKHTAVFLIKHLMYGGSGRKLKKYILVVNEVLKQLNVKEDN